VNPRRTVSIVVAGAAVAFAGSAVLPTTTASAAISCAKYASPNGSDSNAGTTASPYRTAQKVVSNLASGQTGCLLAGSYSGNVTISTDGVTLRSVPGQRATLSLSTLTIPDGAENVTVSDLNIVGGGGALTMRPIGDYFTIARNDITNNHQGMTCVLVGSQAAAASGGDITENKIHGCGAPGNTLDHGIYAQNFTPGTSGGPGLTIVDNLFYNEAAYSVQLYPNGTGAVVQHNVMDGGLGSVRGGVVIDGTTALNHLVQNNVITYTQTGGVVQRSGSGHKSVGNCYWSNPSDVSGTGITRSGDLDADPMFVNRAASDYRLGSSSACLAKVGYDTAAKIAADWAGVPTTTPTAAPTATATPAPTATATAAPAPTATATTTNSAPRVTVTSPTAGSTVTRDLHAVATATDDKGVTKVEFRVDGVLLGTETGAPYDQWLSVGSLARGTHTFQARAYDAAGLTANASVSFTKS
jgi:hypothetical protein